MNILKVENNRIVHHNSTTKEFLQGSSKYICLDNGDCYERKEFFKKVDVYDEEDNKPKIQLSESYEPKPLKKVLDKEETEKKYYRLNKQKVRGKVVAFFDLKQSKKFTAFITISFPKGTTEKDAVKAFNTWLVRCKKIGLKTFIRICEHQENGTIHFHILTNNYLNIRTINYYMACTLDNMGLFKNSESSKEKYNGVDLKHIRNYKGIAAYLTKYVSKSKDKFETYPFHSSRDVSALFYCYSINCKNSQYPIEIENFVKMFPTLVFDNEYACIEYFGAMTLDNGKKHVLSLPNYLKKEQIRINQEIYNNA